MTDKQFAPSFISKVKKNKNGKTFFMFGGLYCSFFKSKKGEDFVRFTILPERPKEETNTDFNKESDFKSDDIPF